ncbi:MAG: UvrD-helicase domain-containing protein [Armatimonadetes bacterium]|nr:UvrD-helicase domain-containing protein [Armatimonadota bacterium]
MIRKVIKASAGTGKTYRLSLEFISLILQYKNQVKFDEIMVITFTKKATAEIRQRIFEHLHSIVQNNEDGKKLIENIKNINSELLFDTNDFEYIQSVYNEMLTNKNKLNISTIDSFTNTVFKGMIAPYHNISDYEIDPEITRQYLPELFDAILQKEHLAEFHDIFFESKSRNLAQYKEFIKSIIRNRWLFHLAQNTFQFDENKIAKVKSDYFNQYKIKILEILYEFQTYLQSYLKEKQIQTDWELLLNKDYFEIFRNFTDLSKISIEDFVEEFSKIFYSKKFIYQNFHLLLEGKNFWNGSKLLKKNSDKETKTQLFEKLTELTEYFANFLFLDKLLPEQEKIKNLAEILLAKYDEIILREKIFTYDDISYLTFRYLYDPEISIIDDKNVLNIFYEQLSYKIRFVLIDEFQDTSVLQWNILHPIISEVLSGEGQKPFGGVIIVGDEKQAIYSWRGGKRELLLRSPQFLETTDKPEILDVSYRSKPKVMNFINELFTHDYFVSQLSHNKINWQSGIVNSSQTSDEGFVEIHLRNRNNKSDRKSLSRTEIYQEFIRETILPLIKEGKINPAESAILARKNRDLNEIAAVLDEFKIDYILESSATIFLHRAIKPVLFLLRFFVYDDIFELLKFLRSDLVLMHSKELKKILIYLQKIENYEEFFQEHPANSFLNRIANSKNDCKCINLLSYVKLIFEQFRISEIFSSEIDIKNIHKFLEITAEFEKQNQEYPSNLSGFLRFIKANEDKEDFYQAGLNETNAIKLMTIHKAKGLEFETVFSVFDLSAKMAGNFKKLNFYTEFNENFKGIDEMFITFNFDKVFQKSFKKELFEKSEIREEIEELNTFYVALTRAKSNQFIFFFYDTRKEIESYISEIEKKEKPAFLMFSTLYNMQKELFQKISESQLIRRIGKLVEPEKESIPEKKTEYDFSEYFSISSEKMLEAKQPQQIFQNYKKSILEDRNILKGIIAHYYLSLVFKDTNENRQKALHRTIADFGGLYSKNKIMEISKKINAFLKKENEYFQYENWDRIFNEHIIFDADGKEYRIDRLLVNTHKKEIMILDFKTGEDFDEKQIAEYRRIIEELPIVKKGNYKVDAKFLYIEI